MYGKQHQWMIKLMKRFPRYSKSDKKILEIGSYDINGTFKTYFGGEYTGLDIAEGNNVDVVSLAHEYKAPERSFDVVYSTNSLEHDIYWRRTLKKMVKLLKQGGLLFIICSGTWSEHGTSKYNPQDSLTTTKDEKWANYYHNLTPQELISGLNVYQNFANGRWQLKMFRGIDLTFWGIKHQIKIRR